MMIGAHAEAAHSFKRSRRQLYTKMTLCACGQSVIFWGEADLNVCVLNQTLNLGRVKLDKFKVECLAGVVPGRIHLTHDARKVGNGHGIGSGCANGFEESVQAEGENIVGIGSHADGGVGACVDLGERLEEGQPLWRRCPKPFVRRWRL